MIKQARVHGPADVRLDEISKPRPGPKDVLVRVRACGICGSDLGYIAQGGLGGGAPLAAPLPIGHEFAGIVDAIGGEVRGITPGMRVAVNPDERYIGGGGPEGAMTPYILISGARLGSTLFPIPDYVSFDQAALSEPLSVALHGINLVNVAATDKVAVIGAGPIGLSAVAMLRHRGVRDISIFDKEDARLERALALGAAVAVNTNKTGITDALAQVHGEGVRFGTRYIETDVFIDAAGAPAALTEAIAIAKYRARILIIALYKKPMLVDLFKMMANEITITGSIADDRSDEFGVVLEMIASGQVDLAPMISHRIGFNHLHEALEIAADGSRSAKVILTFEDEDA
jgi:2-desacetyl-2-hydroxyethyl bacteriochlorophyllide A dehydrogenase